jgi:hypothetical protein
MAAGNAHISGCLAQSTAQRVLVFCTLGKREVIQADSTSTQSNQGISETKLDTLVSIRDLLKHLHRSHGAAGQLLAILFLQPLKVIFECHAPTLPRGNVRSQVAPFGQLFFDRV